MPRVDLRDSYHTLSFTVPLPLEAACLWLSQAATQIPFPAGATPWAYGSLENGEIGLTSWLVSPLPPLPCELGLTVMETAHGTSISHLAFQKSSKQPFRDLQTLARQSFGEQR